MRIGEGDGRPGPTDAWVTLAALGRETSRIRLGTLVTPVTFRHPGALAISVAQADAMSGGRIELGLGGGWYEAEHLAYGIPYPETACAFRHARGPTRDPRPGCGRRPTASGSTTRASSTGSSTRPRCRSRCSDPRPPIIIGGYGAKRTPRLAAAYADEFNLPFSPLDYYRTACDVVRAACDDRRARSGHRSATRPRWSRVSARDEKEFTRRAKAIGHDPVELRKNAAAGTPAEVVERIRAFGEAGAETVYLQILDLADLDHLRLIAAEVAPNV